MEIKKLKESVRVAHNEEQRRPSVAQGVQLQLVIGCDLPQLGNVKHRQPCAAAYQNRLRSFAAANLYLAYWRTAKCWVPALQLIKHQVNGIFELLIVLPDLHAVDHLDEGGEVLFLYRAS